MNTKLENHKTYTQPSHYPNAGNGQDLIGHWLANPNAEWAIAGNIQKYVERAAELPDSDPEKISSLKKALEYTRRWIESKENQS
jgi:hypothetical protein